MPGSLPERRDEAASTPAPWIRLDRNELAGAFGDLGTSLPLLTGMILTAGLHPASVLFTFGTMQILSGLCYGLPISVQPLKAVAALVVAGHLRAGIVWGAGVAIGITMLLLHLFGLIGWLGRRIPLVVVRGLQLGLGLKLAVLACATFIPADGWPGFGLVVASFAAFFFLRKQRRVPPGLLLLGLGVVYALGRHQAPLAAGDGLRLAWPEPAAFTVTDVWQGFVLLALPQIPLSLANSIYATQRTVSDLFPRRSLTTGWLAFTYAVMNLLSPLSGGVPVCHGSGGVAGHYAFGGRTGGSVIICGLTFLVAGLVAGGIFDQCIRLVPLPTLGVLLFLEALTLAKLASAVARKPENVALVLLTALLAASLPYGFGIALVVGTLASRLLRKQNCDV